MSYSVAKRRLKALFYAVEQLLTAAYKNNHHYRLTQGNLMIQGKFSSKNIAQDLEDEILTKKLARGMRLPTGIELSQRYGVSSRTIDRAMVHLSQLGLIERIQGKGTFVRTNNLSFHKKRICLLTQTEETYQESFSNIIFAAFDYLNSKLTRSLSEAGFILEHIHQNIKDNKIHGNISSRAFFLKKKLDTYDFIMLPAGELPDTGHLLRNCKAEKILFMDDTVHPGPWHQIVYDYRPGFQQAIRLFQKIGCHKIISIGFANCETSTHRMEIFREEALELGFKQTDIIEHHMERIPLYQYTPCQDFADDYISKRHPDHGIFCTSDFLMICLTQVFQDRGLVLGRDFKMISYDNFEGRMKDCSFGVTSITHPLDAMTDALQTMLQNVGRQRGEHTFYQTYFVPAQELVIRQSTQLSHHA